MPNNLRKLGELADRWLDINSDDGNEEPLTAVLFC